MRSSKSPLAYREWPARQGASIAPLVALHGKGGDLGQIAPLCASLDPRLRIAVPQAHHALAAPDGSSWSQAEELEQPEAGSFATAVEQVEEFVRDVMACRRSGEFRPLLLGYEQGAILALALAVRLAETLTGVIALRGALPEPSDPLLRGADLTGLPVLLVADPEDERLPRETLKATLSALKERGAVVDLADVDGLSEDPRAAGEILREWTDACLARSIPTDFRWEIGL